MKRYAPIAFAVTVLILAAALTLRSQTAPTTPAGPNTPAVVSVSTDPSGACTMNNLGNAPVFITLNTSTGIISRCKSGTWANDVTNGITWTGNPTPGTAAGQTMGTAALPWSSLFFGSAATNNVKLTAGTLAAGLTINVPDYGVATQQFPGTVFLTGSAYTNATTGLTNVTGLLFPVAANTNYTATCKLTWQGSAGTTGPKWTFTGPAAPTAVNIGAVSAVTATTFTQGVSTAFGTSVNNAGTITTATNFTDTVTLQLINGANAGTVQLQAAANGAGTLTVQPGSWCLAQ